MSISMRPTVSWSSRVSISRSGSWWWKNAPYSRLTPTMPSASCCRLASSSSIRTCMTIWLGSSCVWDWNFTPIQPWHSLPPR